jgi:hypothetical protein
METATMNSGSRRHYDPAGAAVYLDCSKSYLDKERSKGRGPAYTKIAGHIRYEEQDLDAFRAARRIEPTNTADA